MRSLESPKCAYIRRSRFWRHHPFHIHPAWHTSLVTRESLICCDIPTPRSRISLLGNVTHMVADKAIFSICVRYFCLCVRLCLLHEIIIVLHYYVYGLPARIFFLLWSSMVLANWCHNCLTFWDFLEIHFRIDRFDTWVVTRILTIRIYCRIQPKM